VVIMVVRCHSLDLKNFGITWDLPIPTVDAVTSTTRKVTPTTGKSTTALPLVTSTLTPNSSTVTSDFVIEVPLEVSSFNLNNFSRTLREDPSIVPLVPFDLFTEVPLPDDLDPVVPLTQKDIPASTPMIMTFEEMEAEIDKLEAEVEHLNTSDSNSTNIQPNRVNIWALTSKFLATQEGLGFFLTVVASGENFF